MPDGRTTAPAAAPVLVRRRAVADWEAGDREFPPASGAWRLARPALLPLSSVGCVATRESVVALTFDDGPEPATTPALLDVLASAGARATFFLLADRVVAHPGLARRIAAEGHEIGVHGLDHTDLSTLPALEAAARLRRARRRIEDVVGRPVRLARPPYGAQTLLQAALTRAAGLEIVLWSAWARDWEDASSETVAARAVAAVHPGAVLLLHDARGDGAPGELPAHDPATATRLVLDDLARRGYDCATVGELLARLPAVRTFWATRRRPAHRPQASVLGSARG